MSSFYEADLDGPGYEFLRSYSSMNYLYYKLIALNYQEEFCPLYKCPAINKYYFATQAANQVEQQFSFMCLCVWLMRDKCQMNFESNPRDYQDIDATIGVIYEAMKLLLVPDNNDETDIKLNSQSNGELLLFPMGRLKRGFGPEVIFCLNKFADRALELALEEEPNIGLRVEIVFKQSQSKKVNNQQSSANSTNSIIIGQPIVGGGLTTRPLGNYQMDDSSLVLGDSEDYSKLQIERARATSDGGDDEFVLSQVLLVDSNWQQEKLDKIAPLFRMNYDDDDDDDDDAELKNNKQQQHDWHEQLIQASTLLVSVRSFVQRARPILEAMSARIDSQMAIIEASEQRLDLKQQKLQAQVAKFSMTLREYTSEASRNVALNEEINLKTSTFEALTRHLKELRARQVKLTDGTRVMELERCLSQLERETHEMNRELDLRLAKACRLARVARS